MQAAILYGDTRSAGWFAGLIERQEDVTALRATLLLEDQPPTGAVACQ